MTNTNLPDHWTPTELVGAPAYLQRAAKDYAEAYALAALSAQSGQGEAVGGKWDGAEEWMPIAWELCADECGEEACIELVWEGGPIPEPWGDRWLKYEDEAKRLIALVRKHTLPQPAQPSHAVAAIRARLVQEEVRVPKRSDKQDDDFASGLRSGLHIALEMLEAEARPARVVGTVTGYQSANSLQQWQFSPSPDAVGLENQRFDVALSTPTAAPTTSQAAVTELLAALWHIKNTAVSLADAQVIALKALAACAKKEVA